MTNEFLPFATGGGANVIPQATYAANPIVASGFASGIADSRYLNKVWRQSSFIASCFAQYMANTLGVSVLDDGVVANMLAHITAAFGNLAGGTAHEIPYQTAPNTTAYIPAPTTAGQVLNWDGTNFVWSAGGGGDVVHWDTPGAGSGYIIGGNGVNRQWVSLFVAGAADVNVTLTFPSATAFTSEAIVESVVIIDPSRTGSNQSDSLLYGVNNVTLTTVEVFLGQNGGGGRDVTVIVHLIGK